MTKGRHVTLFRTRTPATLFNMVARLCTEQIEQHLERNDLPDHIAEQVQRQKKNPNPWEIDTWLVRHSEAQHQREDVGDVEDVCSEDVNESVEQEKGSATALRFFKYQGGSFCHVADVNKNMHSNPRNSRK